VLAADGDQELVAREDFRGDAANLVEQRRHLAEGQFHLGQREDAHAVHVGADFFVPELHVRRGLQYFPGPVAGP
jgi:hypothetical protein